MDCPRCKLEMHTQKISERTGEIEVDICSHCKGTWYDQGELSDLEKLVKPVFIEVRNIPNEYDQLTALSCPRCKVIMKKAEHSRDVNVILDYCEACAGIWLDGGELTAIQKENWLGSVVDLFKKFHS